jgi:hypothetical protein
MAAVETTALLWQSRRARSVAVSAAGTRASRPSAFLGALAANVPHFNLCPFAQWQSFALTCRVLQSSRPLAPPSRRDAPMAAVETTALPPEESAKQNASEDGGGFIVAKPRRYGSISATIIGRGSRNPRGTISGGLRAVSTSLRRALDVSRQGLR